MTDTERNRRRIRQIEDAVASGDFPTWLAALSEHVRWTVMGSTSWSRTYRGKQAVLDELIAPLRAQYADRYRRRAQQVLADGEWVVARCQGSVTTRAGRRYDNAYCFLYRLRDGMVEEIIEYGDTALIERVLRPAPFPAPDPRARRATE